MEMIMGYMKNYICVLRQIKRFYISVYCLCGLVVRVPGYRSRGPGFDSRRYHIF
jgi:hypothetical protein